MKKIAVTICLVIGVILVTPFVCYAEAVYEPPEQSKEELYQDIFISLLMPYIQRSIDNYYSRSLTVTPTVYPYFVDVVSAERLHGYRSFDFLLKLKVDSVVGPHISVGSDYLTFRIDGSGKVELQKFEHIKTYELPEHWKHIIKKNKRPS